MKNSLVEKTRKRDPEGHRRKIIKAALKLFSKKGFQGTTTKAIAQEAGLAEGTIYVHFKTKQDILFEFIKSEALPSLSGLIPDGPLKNDRDIIRRFLEDRFELFKKNRHTLRVILTEALINPTLAKAHKQNILDPVLQWLETYLNSRIKQKAFRRVSAPIASRAILGLLFSFFMLWGEMTGDLNQLFSDKDAQKELADFIFRGLVQIPEPAKPRLATPLKTIKRGKKP